MEHTLRYLHGDTALQILTNVQRLSCFCPVFFNTTTVAFTELQLTTVEVFAALQAPLSMEFSRQEYQSGVAISFSSLIAAEVSSLPAT